MPVVEINDLDVFGQINDVPAYQLPPEAWTFVENMRYEKNGVAVMSGWAQVFGTPGVAPHFALPVKTTVQTYWLYASLTKIYVYDGTTHTNLTRTVGGDYTANATSNWNGLVFGGVPIMNSGTDVPQYWSAYSLATKMTILANWPATLKAKILRGFGSYLVAFNINDAGTLFPHLVQWSNPASPGTVPTSWAYSNPATEGGRKDLPDTDSGEIIDALQLQNTMFIYKEASIWKMTYIGGQFIFGWDRWLGGVGILGPRCVCVDETGLKHIVVTQDDIISHNGNTVESILTDRQRKTLFESSLNRDTANTSFIFLNRAKQEIWFCYPEIGQDNPTRALVWKYTKGKGAISYASGITFRNAAVGDIQGASDELWEDGSDLWEDDTGPWSIVYRQQVVLTSVTNTKFYQMDIGITRDGVSFIPTLRREDLGVLGKDRKGQWINDFKIEKMMDSIWPKVAGLEPIRVRVGFREFVDGPLTWQDYASYDPVTEVWINAIVNEELPGSGRAVSIEFSKTDSASWRLDGYSMNVEPISVY
jgi:hypothetical protein